jgi:hypothetical protein
VAQRGALQSGSSRSQNTEPVGATPRERCSARSSRLIFFSRGVLIHELAFC